MGNPRPKYQLHGLGKKKPHHPAPFIYTVHRPHAAPKGQEETLIREGGGIHQNKKRYSEHGSRGARAGARAPAQKALEDSPLHLQHRHCTDRQGKTAAPLSWEGTKWSLWPEVPSFQCPALRHGWWPPVQPLSPTSTGWLSSGRAQEASRESQQLLLGLSSGLRGQGKGNGV